MSINRALNYFHKYRDRLVCIFHAMKQDYWNVSDEQVIEKTGKKIAEWIKILDKFKAAEKKSNEVVAFLQEEYDVPRYWARTLTTHYLKQK